MKRKTVDEILMTSLILSFLVSLSFFLPGDITGNASVDKVVLDVREKTDIEFTVFDFRSNIALSDLQNITVEVTNTGSTDYDVTLTEYIYNLTNVSDLNLLSTYVDATVHLYPGNSRGHKVIFAPPEEGVYFIRATVRYGQRLKEIWGSFTVGELPPGGGGGNQTNETNETNQTQPPGGGGQQGGGGGGGGQQGGGSGQQGGGGGGEEGGGEGGELPEGTPGEEQVVPTTPPPEEQKIITTPSIALNYSDRVIVYRNITTLIPIKIINDGNGGLTGLKIETSSPLFFDVDINPKTAQALFKNNSLTFIVSLFTGDGPLGEHVLEFSALSDQTGKDGSILVEVRESPESLKDFIELRILNYEFLIREVSADIEGAALRGVDTRVPTGHISNAMEGLGRAKRFYNESEYVKSFGELLDVEDDIKDAVFTLGNANIKFYARGEPSYWLLIFVVPIVLFLIILHRRRKKGKRPKLLVEAKEE